MAGFDVVFSGSRGHAGTVPMSLRSDALGAAAGFVLAAHEVARSIPGAVATIGRLVTLPGATNTIPGRAELFADLRAPDAAGLDALVERVTAAAAEAAAAGACTSELLPRWRYEPVAMDPATAAAVRRAVAGLGLDPVDLPSGAGHDAAIMATAGIPSAMLFVRSDAGGVSHAPEESTGADAIAALRTGAGVGAQRAGGMTDWEALARPSLHGLERYDPGPSRDQMKERHGLAELEPLNWNEDLFGPPAEALEAAAAELGKVAYYPERAYADFRDAVAAHMGLPAASIIPAHGVQSLIGTIATAFVDAGTTVVTPTPTYGLYAQVSAAAGAEVVRVPGRGLDDRPRCGGRGGPLARRQDGLALRPQQPHRRRCLAGRLVAVPRSAAARTARSSPTRPTWTSPIRHSAPTGSGMWWTAVR